MKKVSFLLFLGAIVISFVIGSPTDDGRIVNGMEIDIKQAPYMVRVLIGDTYCGGSLVAPNYVVTAAHCLDGKDMSHVTIVANVTTIFEEGIRRKVSRWAIHKDYNSTEMHSDIAVLQLDEPIENIRTLKLCEQPLQEGDYIQVSGWGSPVEFTPGTVSLRTVFLPVRSQETCNTEFHRFVKQNMFCASGLEQISACRGDSGGPAVFKGQLCGTVAFSFKCGVIGSQDAYTDAYALKAFIEDFMAFKPSVKPKKWVAVATIVRDKTGAKKFHFSRRQV